MKISHEVPLCMLEESRRFNDFDYALVHLFKQYPDYYKFFEKSLEQGREVILDNSVFELGKPFDEDAYLDWIIQLNPTYAIIPDRFEDTEFTVDSVRRWHLILKKHNIKSIGVIQGRTLSDFCTCYKEIEPFVDKVAISFAQPLFQRMFPLEELDYARMFGRWVLINHLYGQGLINVKKEHHLLGISLPQELRYYKKDAYNFLTSVDSSSPIVHGIKEIFYTKDGLTKKDPIKLVDLFELSEREYERCWEYIHTNINYFKKIANK